jgi:nucleoside 2-deoxyribosyltransferase
MPSAYIASPYGFSPATRTFYLDVVLPAVRAAGVEPLDPWADPEGKRNAGLASAHASPPGDERRAAFAAVNARIGAENETLLRRCDAVLAILDGPDVDSGTAAEVGFAAALGKPAVGLRLDFRPSGDNEGTTVNLQVEHFLVAIECDLDAAVTRLAEVAGVRR